MTFPLNLYSINSILPHLSLIFQNTCFDRGLHIFWVLFFLFFYPLKLVTGFANVTSFKLKNHDSLFDFNNTFKFIYGDHSLSHDTFIVIPTIYSFLSYRISITHWNIITSILCVVFFFFLLLLLIFIYGGLQFLSTVCLLPVVYLRRRCQRQP